MPRDTSARARRKRARATEESAWYNLEVVSWAWAGHSGGSADSVSDYLQLDISVRFETPVDGVECGDLLIYSSTETRGGSIHYDKNRRLLGCLWIDAANLQILATLLAADRQVVLSLVGKSFRYRRMFVDAVYWYMKGHPELRPPSGLEPAEANPQRA